MWNTYRKFLRLPPESKRFVIRIPLILAMTYAGLELFGLKRLLARIQRLVPTAGRLAECGPQEIQTYTHL